MVVRLHNAVIIKHRSQGCNLPSVHAAMIFKKLRHYLEGLCLHHHLHWLYPSLQHTSAMLNTLLLSENLQKHLHSQQWLVYLLPTRFHWQQLQAHCKVNVHIQVGARICRSYTCRLSCPWISPCRPYAASCLALELLLSSIQTAGSLLCSAIS